MSLTSYYSRNQLRHLLHNQLRLKRNHVHHSPYVRNALINPCILLERVNTALRHQHATIEAISVVIKWLWLVLFVLHLLQYGFLILYFLFFVFVFNYYFIIIISQRQLQFYRPKYFRSFYINSFIKFILFSSKQSQIQFNQRQFQVYLRILWLVYNVIHTIIVEKVRNGMIFCFCFLFF